MSRSMFVSIPAAVLIWWGDFAGWEWDWCVADLEYWLMWEIWVFQTSCQSLRSLQSHGRVTALCSGCGWATLRKFLMSSCLRRWVLFFAWAFQVPLLKVRSGSPAIQCKALFYGPLRAQPDGCTLHPHPSTSNLERLNSSLRSATSKHLMGSVLWGMGQHGDSWHQGMANGQAQSTGDVLHLFQGGHRAASAISHAQGRQLAPAGWWVMQPCGSLPRGSVAGSALQDLAGSSERQAAWGSSSAHALGVPPVAGPAVLLLWRAEGQRCKHKRAEQGHKMLLWGWELFLLSFCLLALGGGKRGLSAWVDALAPEPTIFPELVQW